MTRNITRHVRLNTKLTSVYDTGVVQPELPAEVDFFLLGFILRQTRHMKLNNVGVVQSEVDFSLVDGHVVYL